METRDIKAKSDSVRVLLLQRTNCSSLPLEIKASGNIFTTLLSGYGSFSMTLIWLSKITSSALRAPSPQGEGRQST